MANKTPKIMEHLLDRDPSFAFITETWLKSNKSNVTALVKDYDYVLEHNIRSNREKSIGGGVGILLKTNIKYKRVNQKQFSSFEHIVVKVFLTDNSSILLISIYRVLFVSLAVFLDEIAKLLELLVTLKDNIILAGDINIHMEENSLYPNKFKDILETFNVTQHIDFPTHIQGHTLDIVATFGENPNITNITSNVYDVSHHALIDFQISARPKGKQEKEITYRRLKNIDPEKFKEDVTEKLDITEQSFGDNMKKYNKILKDILDEHAPQKKCKIKIVTGAPWFDAEYANLRKSRRKAEKKYQKSKLQEDKENYIRIRKESIKLAHKKKSEYYSKKLEGNNKVLFSTINKLLDKESETILPDANSDYELANSFLNYFTEKIEKIRKSFKVETDSEIPQQPVQDKLVTFKNTTVEEVTQIVKSFAIKCSPEDPVPATLLREYSEIYVPIWTKLVNLSLDQGSMECLRSAVLIPLIKQLDEVTDKDCFKNYRPVSNLQFVGKLVERIVGKRLDEHMTINNLHSDFQHGYKTGHSTETLLLKVVNDLLIACDNQLPSIVMLLDLSAAFDTVDQTKMLSILQNEIGVEGTALRWFSSFLMGRTLRVKIGEVYSDEANLDFGVAQGSVLGPPLFNIYMRSLPKHIEPAKFSIFGFADDHQLIKTFLPLLQVSAFQYNINYCFQLIAEWMNRFFLKLNSSKTKILVFVPPSLRNRIRIEGTFINNECIRFVHSAKNLGIILDDKFSFKKQVMKVVQSSFMIIRKLAKIKYYLTYDHLYTALIALISSRIDYCNSVYFGIHAELLNKLQYVQNSAARLLRRKEKFRGSTIDYIRKCHWLPIRERIIYKLCLMVHKSLFGVAPVCLKEMMTYVSASSRTKQLMSYKCNGKYGARAFIKIGPKIWNMLPQELRIEHDEGIFKSLLKTFLFDGDFYRKLFSY